MNPEERRSRILQLIEQKKYVTISYLTGELFSSEATIRRDLTILEKDGYIKRTTGGALSIKEYYHEQPFNYKSKTCVGEKKYIAGLAADLITSFQTIFMDSSSTCAYLAKKIVDIDNLTILCNGLSTCEILSVNENNHIFCPGGLVNGKYGSVLGETTNRFIGEHFADISFVSCRGLSVSFGASDFVETAAEIKKVFRQNSAQIVLLLDNSKFGKQFFFQGLPLKDIDIIVTDEKPPADLMEAAKIHGIEMIF